MITRRNFLKECIASSVLATIPQVSFSSNFSNNDFSFLNREKESLNIDSQGFSDFYNIGKELEVEEVDSLESLPNTGYELILDKLRKKNPDINPDDISLVKGERHVTAIPEKNSRYANDYLNYSKELKKFLLEHFPNENLSSLELMLAQEFKGDFSEPIGVIGNYRIEKFDTSVETSDISEDITFYMKYVGSKAENMLSYDGNAIAGVDVDIHPQPTYLFLGTGSSRESKLVSPLAEMTSELFKEGIVRYSEENRERFYDVGGEQFISEINRVYEAITESVSIELTKRYFDQIGNPSMFTKRHIEDLFDFLDSSRYQDVREGYNLMKREGLENTVEMFRNSPKEYFKRVVS